MPQPTADVSLRSWDSKEAVFAAFILTTRTAEDGTRRDIEDKQHKQSHLKTEDGKTAQQLERT